LGLVVLVGGEGWGVGGVVGGGGGGGGGGDQNRPWILRTQIPPFCIPVKGSFFFSFLLSSTK